MTLLRTLVTLLCLAALAPAQLHSDLATNGTGPFVDNVPLQGSLAVEVSYFYPYPSARNLDSLTVHGLDLSSSPSTVIGARIYDVDSQRLVACNQITLFSSSTNYSLNLSIEATLEQGKHYRVAVYSSGAAFADMMQPTTFPWLEATQQFEVHGAYHTTGDDYPWIVSAHMPWIELHHFPQDVESYLESGGGGTLSSQDASFASVGVDFTPLTQRRIDGVLVRDLDVAAGSPVAMQVYDSATETVIATGSSTASATSDNVLIPISPTFSPLFVFPDTDYRVVVYIHPESGAAMWEGANGSTFPYVEYHKVFRVNGAYSAFGAPFPTTPMSWVPKIRLLNDRVLGTNMNTGTAVGGANTPMLHSCTTPTIGETLRLRVENGGVGPATIVLAITPNPTQTPLFGLLPMIDTALDTPSIPLSGGKGTLSLPIPWDPAAIGLPLASQAFVPDATSPADLPVSHSDVLVSTLGF